MRMCWFFTTYKLGLQRSTAYKDTVVFSCHGAARGLALGSVHKLARPAHRLREGELAHQDALDCILKLKRSASHTAGSRLCTV
jgi:hypothetical protein